MLGDLMFSTHWPSVLCGFSTEGREASYKVEGRPLLMVAGDSDGARGGHTRKRARHSWALALVYPAMTAATLHSVWEYSRVKMLVLTVAHSPHQPHSDAGFVCSHLLRWELPYIYSKIVK